MSKKFIVVPEYYFEQQKSDHVSLPDKVVVVEETKDYIQQVIDQLPRNLRHRAKVLLLHLENKIKIDKNGEILYNDGSFGGYAYEQLKYYLSTQNFKGPKPLRSSTFEQVASNSPIKQPVSKVKKWVEIFD